MFTTFDSVTEYIVYVSLCILIMYISRIPYIISCKLHVNFTYGVFE